VFKDSDSIVALDVDDTGRLVARRQVAACGAR
jgi:hypothetical protein